MSWSVIETELLDNLNRYRAKHQLDFLKIDRTLHDFSNYCARKIATDNQFMKDSLPKDVLNTIESFDFDEFIVMFEDAMQIDDIMQVGKALKCRANYRKALLDNKFKYIGIGVDATVTNKYYYCVILAR